ncbi:TIGR01777 family oxidoreductase [Aneurinibacillus tyrosinisolvens]|uniref:TIGR01777 family oxidoreductase n=1 Tax=Aneurinibacillus tyrosinisolvens TaxID=1443435 RepID=UPI00063F7695|nr:TIGR01777 family oxidoreductase [Aneurinibacillus tyrosinisolvens]
MRIAIAGGTGFIGTYLIRDWMEKKREVIVITRKCDGRVQGKFPGVRCFSWDDLKRNPSPLEHLDALVNMAGESINSGKWTNEQKERILLSRIESTRSIAQMVGKLTSGPRVILNGSAIGIYGHSTVQKFDESSRAYGSDFLAQVTKKWEEEADHIPAPRIVKIRTGVVLGKDGGAFPKMAFPYRLFAGGKIGSGSQWLSWIHIADYVRLLNFCIERESIAGPINATAPHPVTNDDFGRVLARAAHRPHWLPVPEFAMKLLLGEMADLVLKGQHVEPRKLMEAGFRFEYDTVEKALAELMATE